MKKIVVFSDIHGNCESVKKIIKKEHDADYFVCCGDGCCKLKEMLNLKERFIAVRGNIDAAGVAVSEQEVEINQVKLWIVHGHQFQIQFNLDRLIDRAVEKQIDVTLFGHTHVRYLARHAGIWFFNPGALAAYESQQSYGIIKIPDKLSEKITFEHIIINQKA